MLKNLKQKIVDLLYKPYIQHRNQWIFLKEATKIHHENTRGGDITAFPFSDAKNSFISAKENGHLDDFNRPTNKMASSLMKVWA